MVSHARGLPDAVRQRAVSLARLASHEGNDQVLRDRNLIVASGNRRWGAAILFLEAPADLGTAAAATVDLNRLVAELNEGDTLAIRVVPEMRSREAFSPSVDTLPAIAFKLCERARMIAGFPTAVALSEPDEQRVTVVSVSHGADRRLVGQPVAPGSKAERAAAGDAPLVAETEWELLGSLPSDRRRRGGGGTAYPLRDGRTGIGSLVVFGRRSDVAQDAWEQIMWLAVDMGPQLAAAAAVQAAEDRALRDPLTGLPNRAALQRAMGSAPAGPNSVLCLDLDHFKRLNDAHGHAAGDAALRHVAALFRRALREGDLAARIGGEEFALWLPGAGSGTALDVAERVRSLVSGTPFEWTGTVVPVTCSIGVASTHSAEAIPNLVTAGDAALYRAKRGCRNRVEVASGVGRAGVVREPVGEAWR